MLKCPLWSCRVAYNHTRQSVLRKTPISLSAPLRTVMPGAVLINPRRSKHATWHSYVSRPRHADPIYRRHRLYVNCIPVSVPPRPARGMYLSIYLGTYMMLCRDWLLWPTPPLIHTITHNYYTILTTFLLEWMADCPELPPCSSFVGEPWQIQ